MSKKCLVLLAFGDAKTASREEATSLLRDMFLDEEIFSGSAFSRKIFSKIFPYLFSKKYSEKLKSISIGGISPVYYYAESLREKVSDILGEKVFLGFRYGNQSIKKTLNEAKLEGYDDFYFIPLYPQNASSSTLSAFKEVKKELPSFDDKKFLFSYASREEYVDAIVEKIKSANLKDEEILVSFHSIPIYQNLKVDYECECTKTFEAIRERIGGDRFHLCYHSKTGFGKWLEPNVWDVAKNFRRVAVICPGFFCDCTETLVDIDKVLREKFLSMGGESFKYIRCLNDDSKQAEFLKIFYEELYENI